MNKNLFFDNLDTKWLGRNLELFDKIEYSTNLRIEELASAGAPEGSTVIAGYQKSGRGRMGRSWDVVESGTSLAMSFLLIPDTGIEKLPALTLITALSVREAMVSGGGRDKVRIKWPNDIVFRGKKLCGILLEYRKINKTDHVIAGIGVNIAKNSFPQELSEKAASLEDAGICVCAEVLAARILSSFEKKYEEYISGSSLWTQEYISHMDGIGCDMTVYNSAKAGGTLENADIAASGICEGISSEGRLILRTEAGEILSFYGGEVSIRRK